MKAGKLIAWSLGIGIVLWVGIAAFLFFKDAPSRAHAQTATTTPAVQQPSSDWSLFWWGYMWGGGFGHHDYTIYRDRTNTDYYASPEYQSSGSWGSDDGTWGADNSDSSSDTGWGGEEKSSSGSWGDGWDWSSSDDDGSWGSGWDSSDSSGSWDSGSSWDSSDSGSWGGGDSWSSDSSGSWGD